MLVGFRCTDLLQREGLWLCEEGFDPIRKVRKWCLRYSVKGHLFSNICCTPFPYLSEELKRKLVLVRSAYDSTALEYLLRRSGQVEHVDLRVQFACKEIRDSMNPSERVGMLTDLEIIRECQCPWIVQYFGFSVSEGALFIFLELMMTSLDAVYSRVRLLYIYMEARMCASASLLNRV